MRVSSRRERERERRVEVRREWESEQAETRSSLCTDLLSRSILIIQHCWQSFSCDWAKPAARKRQRESARERGRTEQYDLLLEQSKVWGTKIGLQQEQSAAVDSAKSQRVSVSQKWQRERGSCQPERRQHTLCVPVAWQKGRGRAWAGAACLPFMPGICFVVACACLAPSQAYR